MLRSRVGGAALQPVCVYGDHMVVSMALGLLFLGGGRYYILQSIIIPDLELACFIFTSKISETLINRVLPSFQNYF